jgi:hypothetical protein
MIVISRPIGRRAGDRKPELRPPWSTAVRQLLCLRDFLRGHHAPRRATPSLPYPVDCHIGPNLSKNGQARKASYAERSLGVRPCIRQEKGRIGRVARETVSQSWVHVPRKMPDPDREQPPLRPGALSENMVRRGMVGSVPPIRTLKTPDRPRSGQNSVSRRNSLFKPAGLW